MTVWGDTPKVPGAQPEMNRRDATAIAPTRASEGVTMPTAQGRFDARGRGMTKRLKGKAFRNDERSPSTRRRLFAETAVRPRRGQPTASVSWIAGMASAAREIAARGCTRRCGIADASALCCFSRVVSIPANRQPEPSLPPVGPSKIGKYDVEERVGEGAMGVVYRALDPVLQRRVAIKVMSDAFAQNDDLRERFLREAQAAGSLQHPNVITIYDFGEVDGHLYIAMEFVEGQDVAELLAHQVPLTLTNKLDIAIGVLQGLSFAHKRGIVHRDVKPANIRVDADGNARIMDFGVAHLASSEMTRSGVMIGTPSYMAPEQIVGGKVGPETDIFSVGAVLYELLTGSRPFAGGPLQAVMYRVLSETPMPLDVAAPGLPAKLNEIVMRALTKDPEKRYSSALTMANDLLAVRATLDASVSSPGTVSLRHTIETALDQRRTSQFKAIRRRRIALSGAGIVAAAVLVLSGWFIARRSIHPDPAPAATLAGSVTPPATAPASAATSASATPPSASPSTQQQESDRPRTVQNDKRASSSPAAPSGQRVAEQPASKKAPRGTVSPPITNAAPPSTAQPVIRSPVNGGTTPTSAIATVPPPVAPPASSAPANTTAVKPNPPVSIAPTSAVTPATTTNATPPTASSANASTEIGNVIDSYARAIESRDMSQLRRVYGMITSDQASAFSEFFSSTRTLRALLAVKSVQVDGNRATAQVAGTYEFTTTAGRAQQQPVTFQADLRHEAGSWKLVAVR